MVVTRAARTRHLDRLARGLELLSDDLLMHVFSFFPAEALWCFIHLNKRLSRIASEDLLWRPLLMRELGGCMSLPAPGPGGWRRRYLRWHDLKSSPTASREEQLPPIEQMAGVATPRARFLHRAACLLGRYLYVFGGRGEDSEYGDMWLLDQQLAYPLPGLPAASTSDASPAPTRPPSAAASSSAAAAPPRALLPPSPSPLAPLRPPSALFGAPWRLLSQPDGAAVPSHHQSATLTAVDSQLIMFGGRQGEQTFLNDTWSFDTAAHSWTCLLPSDDTHDMHTAAAGAPCPRWAHSAVCFGSSVLVFGGSSPGRCFSDLRWFDVPTKSWRVQHTHELRSPPARSGHCACAVGERMFLFGGNTTKASFNDLWSYDTKRVRAPHRARAAKRETLPHTHTHTHPHTALRPPHRSCGLSSSRSASRRPAASATPSRWSARISSCSGAGSTRPTVSTTRCT